MCPGNQRSGLKGRNNKAQGQVRSRTQPWGLGHQETSVLKGRENATSLNAGILADFQPAERVVDGPPRPPTHAALRSAWVSDLGSVVSALQAGEQHAQGTPR